MAASACAWARPPRCSRRIYSSTCSRRRSKWKRDPWAGRASRFAARSRCPEKLFFAQQFGAEIFPELGKILPSKKLSWIARKAGDAGERALHPLRMAPRSNHRRLRAREDGENPSPPRDCKAGSASGAGHCCEALLTGCRGGKTAPFMRRQARRPAGQPSPPAREGEEDKCEHGPLAVSWLFCFLASRAFPTASPPRPALRLSPARSAIQAA